MWERQDSDMLNALWKDIQFMESGIQYKTDWLCLLGLNLLKIFCLLIHSIFSIKTFIFTYNEPYFFFSHIYMFLHNCSQGSGWGACVYLKLKKRKKKKKKKEMQRTDWKIVQWTLECIKFNWSDTPGFESFFYHFMCELEQWLTLRRILWDSLFLVSKKKVLAS